MKLKIIGLIIVALAMASCNAVENQSTSASMLQIISLTDIKKKLPFFSNVSEYINDIATVNMNALPLDPLATSKTGATPYLDVLIDQVDVEFKRPDGRNVEGVDVPYRFTQPMSFRVPINGTAEFPINVIRHVAKLEPPLLALSVVVNQAKQLELIAVVTFHGKDLGGHRVTPVTGYINIWCGSFTVAD